MGFIQDLYAGGGDTDTSQLTNMTMGNQTNQNLDYGAQIAARQGTDPSTQFRNAQTGLISQLQAQAAGQGPSLAQGQMADATNDNINAQMAMAASGRGANSGYGQRLAAQNLSATNQQAAGQSAQLRMQEQLAAQSQLAGVTAQGRNADIANQTANDNFTNNLRNMGNQRDMGQYTGQMQAQEAALKAQAEDKKRKAAAFQAMMSALGTTMFTGGSGGGGGGGDEGGGSGGSTAMSGGSMMSMAAMA